MRRAASTAVERSGWRYLAFLVAILTACLASLSQTMAASNLLPTSFAELNAWEQDRHEEALAVFRRSCREIVEKGNAFAREVRNGGRREDWLDVCRRAAEVEPGEARSFFERHFLPVRVNDPDRPRGLLTGYFEPEAEGSLEGGGRYRVPLYAKPPELVAFDAKARAATGLAYGRMAPEGPRPFHTRREIEEGALAGRNLELVWLTDWADAFFMQVQGSGRVRLPDGNLVRLSFAAKTGLPYTAIGGILIERGAIARDDVSMQSIRAWMSLNPAEARGLMWKNESYVFFRKSEVADRSLGPPGAQKVPLTAGRSLAVDRALWAFGTPIWLDTTFPTSGGEKPLRRLMIAQDTGTAIKGLARGDVFWGAGDEAAYIAGHMKSPGRMFVLLPKPVAKRLGLTLR